MLSTVVAVAANKYVCQSLVFLCDNLQERETFPVFQAEEAGEVHVGQRRGHVDHWRETPLLWEVQGRTTPPAGEGLSSLCWRRSLSQHLESSGFLMVLLLWLQVGFLSSGKVVALDVSYYSNAGHSMDLSLSVSSASNRRVFPSHTVL